VLQTGFRGKSSARSRCPSGELAAAGGNVDAAPLADCAVDAVFAQHRLKRARIRRRGGEPS